MTMCAKCGEPLPGTPNAYDPCMCGAAVVERAPSNDLEAIEDELLAYGRTVRKVIRELRALRSALSAAQQERDEWRKAVVEARIRESVRAVSPSPEPDK